MGTEVAISFSSLRSQLENEKSSLYKIDENIKKIVQQSGRFNSQRFPASADYNRGGARPGARNSYPDTGSFAKTDDGFKRSSFAKTDDGFSKRKHEATKTVFSRLSARAGDSDGEEGLADIPVKRPRVGSAVSREMPSRAAVLQAQAGDEAARTRNRRMFGSLLGTLQKFKQEEITLHSKEEKKAQVERKIEEQARLEQERAQAERKSLFAEREQRKAKIKALEAKMARVGEFERWESSQRPLSNFILTRAKPHVYWLPKVMNAVAKEKLTHSRNYHDKCMSKKRAELQEELQRIEQRILQGRPPRGGRADPSGGHDQPRAGTKPQTREHQTRSKRDKFASDADHHMEESDHDDLLHDKDASRNKRNSTEDATEPPPPGTEDISIPQEGEDGTPERNNGEPSYDENEKPPSDENEKPPCDDNEKPPCDENEKPRRDQNGTQDNDDSAKYNNVDNQNGPDTSELVQNGSKSMEIDCNEAVHEPESNVAVQNEPQINVAVQNESENNNSEHSQ